jgi:hypothetical protein
MECIPSSVVMHNADYMLVTFENDSKATLFKLRWHEHSIRDPEGV